MPTPTSLNLGSVVGPDAYSVWCSKQDPALDPDLGASWDAFMAAIKGETGAPGAPGAAGLTQEQVDDRIAEANLQAALTFDDAPTSDSDNPVTSGGVYTALADKQATLEWDTTPTEDSTNPVTSGGVHAAITAAVAAADIGDTGWVAMEMNSNVVSSGGIYYRVKNGVVYFSGSFVAKGQSPSAPLTTSSLPEGVAPCSHYGAAPVMSADCGVWYLPHVWFHAAERRPYLGGIIYLGNGSVVGLTINMTIQLKPDALFVIG